MRIIAGEKRSRKLIAPDGLDTRPTADRVKEALFSILMSRLYGARVLDLYAGSGALSLEALSRGAASAVLVDQDRKAAQAIKQNIESLGFQDQAKFMNVPDKTALRSLAGQSFDLIFLDPPYRMDTSSTCDELESSGLLAPGGVILVEHAKSTPPHPSERLICFDRREYGVTGLSFYRRAGEEEE